MLHERIAYVVAKRSINVWGGEPVVMNSALNNCYRDICSICQVNIANAMPSRRSQFLFAAQCNLMLSVRLYIVYDCRQKACPCMIPFEV